MVASRWIFKARGLSLRRIKEDEPILEEDMDRDQMVGIIRRRLNLKDQDWSIIENNPKFQQLFENAVEASKYDGFVKSRHWCHCERSEAVRPRAHSREAISFNVSS